jgi:Rps23 Pro-64 3,4-dihydroxylase Tpa1-like proline 4-hydroxylase
MWTTQIVRGPSNFDYNDLISGKIPALIIPDVLSKSICASLSNKILNLNSITSIPRISKKIGTSISSHIYKKSKYFSNAKISNQSLKNIFSENDSPIDVMQQTISKVFEKQMFTANENGMTYSYAMIRIHEHGDSIHLHRDNSNFEMSEYGISDLNNQLSAILYLQSPFHGGKLTIYDKMWNKNDEQMRCPEFGYSSDLIKNTSQKKIPPITGNMVVFNPKLYHKVESVIGIKSRITLGFFFGEMSKNYFCSWT